MCRPVLPLQLGEEPPTRPGVGDEQTDVVLIEVRGVAVAVAVEVLEVVVPGELGPIQ